mmetsp:Transcript_4789/g.21675  ORF Transcript_4789/g.21675 Transcript_4789/m.21675 type:complete len:293 (+) Transcript_4789:2258-3136(+)
MLRHEVLDERRAGHAERRGVANRGAPQLLLFGHLRLLFDRIRITRELHPEPSIAEVRPARLVCRRLRPFRILQRSHRHHAPRHRRVEHVDPGNIAKLPETFCHPLGGHPDARTHAVDEQEPRRRQRVPRLTHRNRRGRRWIALCRHGCVRVVENERLERVSELFAERHSVSPRVAEERGGFERRRQGLHSRRRHHPVGIAVHVHGPGGDVRGVERSRRARVHRLKAGEEDRESHRVPQGRDERERERGGGRALRETQDAVERAVCFHRGGDGGRGVVPAAHLPRLHGANRRC